MTLVQTPRTDVPELRRPAADRRPASDALARARVHLETDDARTIADQVELAEIPAPSGDEGARARWLAARLEREGGCRVHVDDVGNVVARREGSEHLPAIALCAHLDTVFPAGTPLGVQRHGSRLVGPGINDNARGVAALVAIARTIQALGVRTRRPLELVGTVGEEGCGDLRGAKHYFADPDRDVAAAIALDGAGDERVVHRALGSRRVRVEFVGCGGHSWGAFGVPNAVHAAADCAARLARLPLPRTPRTTLSVGRIGGGISINAIPATAWLEVDVRSTEAAPLDRLEREIRGAAEQALGEENGRRASGTSPLTVLLHRIGDRPGGAVAAAHPLVLAALDATRAIGSEPELALASTDANVPISRGIPAVAIGAGGRGGDAHTPDEWFENVNGPRGILRALTLVLAAAEL